MTDFEEKLLTTSIIMSNETNKMIGGILRSIQCEDVGHKGDYFETIIATAIMDYIKTLGLSDDEIDIIYQDRIHPQLVVGNYINIITEIRQIESSHRKEDE